jgi:hypothetical protein
VTFRIGPLLAIACALGAGAAPSLEGQAAAPARLAVYLDCHVHGCDRNFFITELPYVVWTQDRLDADVHLLATGLETGAGGSAITLAVIGQGRFAGRSDTLETSLPPNTTHDAARNELARVIKLSFVPYLLHTAVSSRLALAYDAPDEAEGARDVRALIASDPWNLWVYRAEVSGSGEKESRSSEWSFEGELSATRVTEDWKLGVQGEFEYEANAFELDSSTVEFVLRRGDLETYAARSLTDHWSLGSAIGVSMSAFQNQDLAASIDAALEYSVYPYAEATRRQFVFALSLGGRHFNYAETTIYERDEETRMVMRALVAAESRQPWGSFNASLDHTRYLHDAGIYGVSLDASINIRVSRGLSVNFGANAEKVNDQLYLPRGDASDDEVLTEQRELATAYRVSAFAGVSFTFGSIFNTIVNPRFDRF